MSQETIRRWEGMRTDESRRVERLLRRKFPNTDAYRYNSASLRVRVIDDRFKGMSNEERDSMVEPLLKKLPKKTQDDIMNLITLSPDEAAHFSSNSLMNLEFEEPSPSML
jgi:stress-induced morphogen